MSALRAVAKYTAATIGLGLLFALTFHVGYNILPNFTG